MAMASDMLVLNFTAAEAPHQRQEEEGAVADDGQNSERRRAFWQHAVISRIIASSLTIEPPMIAGISGDMVPISASRIPGANSA